MNNKRINVTSPSLADYNEYIDEIKDLWDSKWLTNNGIKHQKLEKEISDFLKVDNSVLFNNGHLALETAIQSFGLTGEVITTPFTFVSTTNAIVRSGLKPVFCDINKKDYTIDVNLIESLITEKTSAIIPVHVYGNICDVQKIEELAAKYNLKVIYDSAHAFGVEINGRGISCFGDVSMFSFHSTKVFNTIEGGALAFNNSGLYEQFNSFKNFGICKDGSVKSIGTNGKMNEFQAAMGLCNLKRVANDIEKRRVLVNQYKDNLSSIGGITFVSEQEGVKHNYSYMPIVFEDSNKSRDKIANILEDNNIFARKYFYPLINNMECYTNFKDVDLPVATYIADRVLTLPLYSDLEIDDVNRICDIILSK